MTELALNRTRRDRRLYALEGIGTLRLQAMLAHSAVVGHDICELGLIAARPLRSLAPVIALPKAVASQL